MASQVSPGILVKERDLTNAVVTGVLQIRAAHASSFAKGPVGQIVNINSQKELISVFGQPNENNAEDWLVASEFLNYGGRLAVVRTDGGVLNATTGGAGIKIATEEDWLAGAGTSEQFAARTAGTWGNSLLGVIVDKGPDYIVDLASAPSTATIAVGDAIAFSGGVTGTVISGTQDALVITTSAAITTSSTFTDGGSTIALESVKDWYLNTTIGSTGVKLSAIAPRPSSTQHALDNGASNDAVHFAVIDTTGEVSGAPNTIIERFTYLSKISDATSEENSNIYYKSVVNAFSRFMFIGTSPSTDANMTGEAWDQATAAVTGAVARVGSFEDQLENGADDYLYTTGEFQGAMDLFLDTEETDIDFVLMGGSMASETDTKAKATKVIAVADGRKDCVAFVSAHKANQIASSGNTALTSIQQKENTIAFFDGLASTSYAVFDSGYKYVYDRFSDKYRYIP